MDKLQVLYFNVCDVWKDFCEEHNTLLDQTCKEYSVLLGCDLDELDRVLAKKQETIDRINKIDTFRTKIIKEVSLECKKEIGGVAELLTVMRDIEKKIDQKHLTRYNLFLIDIIEKIQTQNKKNQLFINKALISINDIKASVRGKEYSTYTPKGTTTHNLTKNNRS